jgi:hypothetical protein
MPRVAKASALLVAALAAGCSHAPPARPGGAGAPGPAELFPLAVGNSWTYLDRSPALPPGSRPPERTVRILSRTADGFYRDSDRGELRVDGDCLRDRLRRLLCAPVEAGRSWVSVTGVSSTERYEIVATGERVRTPAGTFGGCVRVRAHVRAGPEAENVLELTYAPGVGPVRIETFAVVGGKATTQVSAELQSYSLQR